MDNYYYRGLPYQRPRDMPPIFRPRDGNSHAFREPWHQNSTSHNRRPALRISRDQPPRRGILGDKPGLLGNRPPSRGFHHNDQPSYSQDYYPESQRNNVNCVPSRPAYSMPMDERMLHRQKSYSDSTAEREYNANPHVNSYYPCLDPRKRHHESPSSTNIPSDPRKRHHKSPSSANIPSDPRKRHHESQSSANIPLKRNSSHLGPKNGFRHDRRHYRESEIQRRESSDESPYHKKEVSKCHSTYESQKYSDCKMKKPLIRSNRRHLETANGLYPTRSSRVNQSASKHDASSVAKVQPNNVTQPAPSTSKEMCKYDNSQACTDKNMPSHDNEKTSVLLHEPEKSVANLINKLYSGDSTIEKNISGGNSSTSHLNSESDVKLVTDTKIDKNEISKEQNDIVMRCERQQSKVFISASKPYIQKRIQRNIETKSILHVDKTLNKTSVENEVLSKEIIEISSIAGQCEEQVCINSSTEVKSSCSKNVWNISSTGSPMKVSEERSESQSIKVTKYPECIIANESKEVSVDNIKKACKGRATKSFHNSPLPNNEINDKVIVTRSRTSMPSYRTRNSSSEGNPTAPAMKVKKQATDKKVNKFKLSNFVVDDQKRDSVVACQSPPASKQNKVKDSLHTKVPLKNTDNTQKKMAHKPLPKPVSVSNANSSNNTKLKSGPSTDLHDKIKLSREMAAKSKSLTSKIKKASSCIQNVQKARKSCGGLNTNVSSQSPQTVTPIKSSKKRRKYFRGGRYQLYLHGRPKKKKSPSSKVPKKLPIKNQARKSFSTSIVPVSKLVSITSEKETKLVIHNIPSRTSRKTFAKRNTSLSNTMIGGSVQCISNLAQNVRKTNTARKSFANGFNYSSSDVTECLENGFLKRNINFSRSSWQASTVMKKNGLETNFSLQSQRYSKTVYTTAGLQPKKFICACLEKPGTAEANDSVNGIMCQALNSVDGTFHECPSRVTCIIYARPSAKLQLIEMCNIHLMRLRGHECCPVCGVFCTQGPFLACKASKLTYHDDQAHLFHKECWTEGEPCPHCKMTECIEPVNLLLVPKQSQNGYYMSIITSQPTSKKVISSIATSSFYSKNDSKRSTSTALVPLAERTLHFTRERSDKRSMKSFYMALKHGDNSRVYHFLRNGIRANHKFDGDDYNDDDKSNNNTPLHIAAKCGHFNVLKLLIRSGAVLDSVNDSLMTPLILACRMKHFAIVQYLLVLGASITWPGEDGLTCFHVASKVGSLEICKLIYKTRKISIDVQDDGGWTPLVWACDHKHMKVISWLLEAGANPLIFDKEGNLALHWAAFSGDEKILQLLLATSCNVDSINALGDTPLHIAARTGNYDCTVLLMRKGANATIMNLKKSTPYMVCDSEHTEIRKALQWYCSANLVGNHLIHKTDREVYRDITNGREFCCIPVINDINDEKFKMTFRYVKQLCESNTAFIDKNVNRMSSCKCSNECPKTCTCICWYTKDGLLGWDFDASRMQIYECNKLCHCSFSCPNKVTQRGIKVPLQVFRTKFKGWGIRSVNAMPKGTFVCQYIGELLTTEEARTHQPESSYVFELEAGYCIESSRYGNVSRFLNHSCSPNLVAVKVFAEHQDLRFPNIAFFTCKDIAPKEELTFDYGVKFWVSKCRTELCACLSEFCAYDGMTIQKSLDDVLDPKGTEELEELAIEMELNEEANDMIIIDSSDDDVRIIEPSCSS